MQKKKSIITRSLVAGAIMTVSGFSANATGMFNYNSLGTGEEVRSSLLDREESTKSFELKCGEKGKGDSTTAKKGKDGKCGEGKCGDKKKDDMSKGKADKKGAGKKSA